VPPARPPPPLERSRGAGGDCDLPPACRRQRKHPPLSVIELKRSHSHEPNDAQLEFNASNRCGLHSERCPLERATHRRRRCPTLIITAALPDGSRDAPGARARAAERAAAAAAAAATRAARPAAGAAARAAVAVAAAAAASAARQQRPTLVRGCWLSRSSLDRPHGRAAASSQTPRQPPSRVGFGYYSQLRTLKGSSTCATMTTIGCRSGRAAVTLDHVSPSPSPARLGLSTSRQVVGLPTPLRHPNAVQRAGQ
jgi:hypothetical protein